MALDEDEADDQVPWHCTADDQDHCRGGPNAQYDHDCADDEDVFSCRATSCTMSEEFSTVEEQIEQDAVIAFIAAGATMDDQQAAGNIRWCPRWVLLDAPNARWMIGSRIET